MTGTERARWLAELSEVLDRAQDLIESLDTTRRRSPMALDLSARLAAAQAEVRALRLGRSNDVREDARPEWSKHVPWYRPKSEEVG